MATPLLNQVLLQLQFKENEHRIRIDYLRDVCFDLNFTSKLETKPTYILTFMVRKELRRMIRSLRPVSIEAMTSKWEKEEENDYEGMQAFYEELFNEDEGGEVRDHLLQKREEFAKGMFSGLMEEAVGRGGGVTS